MSQQETVLHVPVYETEGNNIHWEIILGKCRFIYTLSVLFQSTPVLVYLLVVLWTKDTWRNKPSNTKRYIRMETTEHIYIYIYIYYTDICRCKLYKMLRGYLRSLQSSNGCSRTQHASCFSSQSYQNSRVMSKHIRLPGQMPRWKSVCSRTA